MFPSCTIDAGDRHAEHQRRVAELAPYGITVEPSLAVRVHGKNGELLGVWRGRDYAYAAVRFPWHGRYGYDLLHPDFVRS